MKRLFLMGAAVSVLAFGLPAAQACPGAMADLSPSLTKVSAVDQATDLSAAKKKKKVRRSAGKGGGASKAGTGGGAGGEAGAGSTSETQQGKPRGVPAVR